MPRSRAIVVSALVGAAAAAVMTAGVAFAQGDGGFGGGGFGRHHRDGGFYMFLPMIVLIGVVALAIVLWRGRSSGAPASVAAPPAGVSHPQRPGDPGRSPGTRRDQPRRLPRLGRGAARTPATARSADQPTLPSICSSIRRLHSTAYSIGSVRVIGSMNPLTTMLIACSCDRPRLIR